MATAELDQIRDKYRAKIATALQEDEDPLATYETFVKWTVENYPDKLIARSGLLELLEETTRQFKDDEAYKGDLRYLKLWMLYANNVEHPPTVFSFLLKNNIGSVYAQLYEEYAMALLAIGRNADAEKVFQAGIRRRARPAERLKKRFSEFQAGTLKIPPKPSGSLWEGASSGTLTLRKNPLRNHSASRPKAGPSSSAQASTSGQSSTTTAPKPPPPNISSSSTPANFSQDRYAHIRAPPVPGKRPEKLRFNLSLLFTDDNVEYCIEEARARSKGLLGKKWGPPPKTDDSKNDRKIKKPAVYAEPTVTMATKEALADVFGMYNSPEKTMKHGIAGSKHAPVRKIEPITPMALHRLPSLETDADRTLIPPNGLLDPNVGRKENSLPTVTPKFKPFVDENAMRPPAITPDPGRRALGAKDPGTVTKSNENELRPKTPSVFRPLEDKPPVFTPAGGPLSIRPLSRQDIFTDDAATPTAPTAPPPKLAPFVDSQPQPTTFNVFSRPPPASENASAPRAALQALHGGARQPFVPVRSGLALSQQQPPPTQPQQSLHSSSSSASSEDDPDQYDAPPTEAQELHDDSFSSTTESDDNEGEGAYVYMENAQQQGEEEDSSAYEEEEEFSAPLPRRGQLNVMTPITERTFEYTSTVHNTGTPSHTRQSHPQVDPVDTAAQLAAELQLEEEEEHDDEMDDAEEKTGTKLFDALSIASKFNPPNPCNPFDPSIMSTVMSLLPADPGFHDLRQQESAQLEALQKFAKKKTRRSSGNSIGEDHYEVSLANRPYAVLEKLGEGGFGAVFEAVDVQAFEQMHEGREDDDYDEDEEEVPKVALKVVKPRSLWEFHVLRRIHLTLPAQVKRSIITPNALFAYRDESFLVLEHCSQGTLLDVVNNAPKSGITQQGACLDELLVVFFSIEIMHLLEAMHTAGFIHGDMKIDNCLLRLEDVPGPATAWTSVYQSTGEGGWSYKGIKMIDFGRTIDMRLFPVGQQYTGDWATDARDCIEMREGRPWTYQTDYFGLAGIIYCMLYGKYIEAASVTADADGQYKLATPFKRYWNVDLWTRLFGVLLNSGSVRPEGQLPLCEEMAELRKEMEGWLQTHCNRGSNSLKGLLKKIGLSLLQ